MSENYSEELHSSPHNMKSEIFFESLDEKHFSLVHKWFNLTHVQAFYSLREWTIEEISKKLEPYIQGVGEIRCYIVCIHGKSIGYVQSYPVKLHPWDNQNLSESVIQDSAGVDLFIGEEKYIGKGNACKILDAFLEQYIWPFYRYCLADPNILNEPSLRLFKKCGFQECCLIRTKDALQRPVTLQLFIKEREAKFTGI